MRWFSTAALVLLAVCYLGILLAPNISTHLVTDAQESQLAGDWRGVFGHKNMAAGIMAMLTGCVQPVIDPGINEASIELLTNLGVEVVRGHVGGLRPRRGDGGDVNWRDLSHGFTIRAAAADSLNSWGSTGGCGKRKSASCRGKRTCVRAVLHRNRGRIRPLSTTAVAA